MLFGLFRFIIDQKINPAGSPNTFPMKLLSILLFVLYINPLITKELYDEQFEWRITLPDDFEEVSSEEWKRLQQTGEDAIEDTFNEEIENFTKTIFVFKKGDYNYFESNYQPYDEAIDGNYLEASQSVNEIVYETLATQLADAIVDSSSSVQTIAGLEFQHFHVSAELTGVVTINIQSFSRLFGDQDFTVNITYIDEREGDIMLDAWRNSTFGKQ